MDTTTFEFTFPYQVEIPLFGHVEHLYRVTVQPEPVYDYCTTSRADVFQDVDFHIESIVMDGIPVSPCATDQTSRKFYSLIKDAARWHYDQRHGSTDFETVTIHDRVDGIDVTVIDNLHAA